MVIYCGTDSWTVETRLGDMITAYHLLPEGIKKYVPDYEYPFYNLGEYDVEAMKDHVRTKIMILAFQSVYQHRKKGLDSRDVILKAGEYLRNTEDQEDAMECFTTLIHYLTREGKPMTKEEIDATAERLKGIYLKGSEVMKSTADLLREEGIQLGEARGEARGETKALVKIALRLLRKKFGPLPNDIEDKVNRMKPGDLEAMIDEVLDYKSIEDAKKWLH